VHARDDDAVLGLGDVSLQVLVLEAHGPIDMSGQDHSDAVLPCL